ncbi:MAG TPA: hypothetical protein VGW75_12330, partial [Solirubrobacteraceae bacterium]|nr:hypothetical protein [Solirubrobacteraceae bacterium]
MRTDPTDNGGLFIGRRPGTAPLRYRGAPQRSAGARRAFDRLLAAAVLAVMVLVSIAFWGPIPAAWLWLGAQVEHHTGSGGLAIALSSVGMLLTLLAGLVLLKQLDHFWMLVRRASGCDQRTGAIGPVFTAATVVAVALFAIWFLVF